MRRSLGPPQSYLFLHSAHSIDGIRVAILRQFAQSLDGQGASQAVVKGLG